MKEPKNSVEHLKIVIESPPEEKKTQLRFEKEISEKTEPKFEKEAKI